MPIYEFYCEDCHTIFNFFSRRIDTETRPPCPRCTRSELARQVSLFSISRGRKEAQEDMPDVDEARMEQAFASLASEMEGVNEDDPRQVGRIVRKLYDTTGMKLGGGMEEALRRMEAGDDPDAIEEELGDVLEGEDPFAELSKRPSADDLRRRFLPPRVDETLYELQPPE